MNDFMDYLSKNGAGSGIGQLLGGLFGLFGGNKGKNPADSAMGYLDQIPEQMRPFFEKYMNAGGDALSSLMPEYQKLLGGDVYNKLASGYKESPGYKHALQEALGASSNAAAAGGMLGTPMAQQNAMETAQGVSSKDFKDYMASQMGLYGQGLSGLSDINKMGYGANTDFANMLGSLFGQKAQYAYAGQDAANKAKSQNWSDIFGGIGGLLPFLNGKF